MAGTLDIITRAFAGCRTDGECVHLDPLLPRGLGAAGFQVQHRGQRLLVDLDPDGARVAADPCAANSTVSVRVAQ
ncbi:glycosyl hydrolase family 65 protein [Aestuariimicrobium sp. Y1814]|uniref:glycosyl hydrolase family 65 protein n=1 Tax=Aestuariimicrobium sp. Y1814 TaxID=3418742 RepID=UPI003DA710C7